MPTGPCSSLAAVGPRSPGHGIVWIASILDRCLPLVVFRRLGKRYLPCGIRKLIQRGFFVFVGDGSSPADHMGVNPRKPS